MLQRMGERIHLRVLILPTSPLSPAGIFTSKSRQFKDLRLCAKGTLHLEKKNLLCYSNCMIIILQNGENWDKSI